MFDLEFHFVRVLHRVKSLHRVARRKSVCLQLAPLAWVPGLGHTQCRQESE